MAGRRKESITIKDPRALRALAHPARQRLIHELFSGRVLTATEAADMVGLTPSAVSHHLRALEKYGLARRAVSSNDGRERPWEGTARTLRLQPSSMPGSLPAMQSVVAQHLGTFAGQLDAFLTSRTAEPWEGAFQGLATGELHLTREEAREVGEAVVAALGKYDTAGRSRRPPRGTRRTSFLFSMIPIEDAPHE